MAVLKVALITEAVTPTANELDFETFINTTWAAAKGHTVTVTSYARSLSDLRAQVEAAGENYFFVSPQCNTFSDATFPLIAIDGVLGNIYRSRSEFLIASGAFTQNNITKIEIITPSSPLAAGYTGTPTILSTPTGWVGADFIATDAVHVAQIDDIGNRPVVYTLDAGNGEKFIDNTTVVPARRAVIGFPVGGSPNDVTSVYTDILSAALDWAAASSLPSVPDIASTTVGATIFAGQGFSADVVMVNQGNPAPVFDLVGAPPEVQINPSTGQFSIANPIEGTNYSFTITATNSEGSDSILVAFVVVAAPAIVWTNKKSAIVLAFDDLNDLGKDYTGEDRDAINVNVTQSNAGISSNTGLFNGTDAYINCNHLIAPYLNKANIGFKCEVEWNSTSGAAVIFSIGSSVDGQHNWTLWRNGTSLVFHYRDGADTKDYTHTELSAFTTGTKYEITGHFGLNGWAIRLDGVLLASGAEVANLATLNAINAIDYWYVGAWFASGSVGLFASAHMKDVVFTETIIDEKTDEMYRGVPTSGVRRLGMIVYNCAGQSNREGNALIQSGIDDNYDIVAGLAYVFRNDNSTIDEFSQPVNTVTPIAGAMSAALGEARAMIDNLPYGMGLLIANFANGNTNLGSDWAPPLGAELVNFKAKTISAMQTATTNVYSGLNWMIGENDADLGSTAVDIVNYFTAIMTDLNSAFSDFFNSTVDPVGFTSIVGPNNDIPSRDVVNTGLSNFADTQGNYIYIDCTSYAVLFDVYHLNQVSLRRLGAQNALEMFGMKFNNSIVLDTAAVEPVDAPFTVDVVIRDDIQNMTTGNVTVDTGSVLSVVGSGKNWTITCAPPASGSGTMNISIAFGAVVDEYETGTLASNSLAVGFEVLTPANVGWVSPEPLTDANGVLLSNTSITWHVKDDVSDADSVSGTTSTDGAGILTIDSDLAGNVGDVVQIPLILDGEESIILQNQTLIDLDAL